MKKTKTVYCLRIMVDTKWSEPEYFSSRKERDKTASINRSIGGIITHSYEEKKLIED